MPQVDFRFPSHRRDSSRSGVKLELRQALEPWNVLAEETASGRTGRSVDSSLERIQIKVSGLSSGLAIESRYVALCNNRRIPLTSTSEPGVSIAGIRYRARRLSATLHPTIPVHAPLVFELDRHRRRARPRSLHLLRRHLPTARIYPKRPVDAAEARTRREERFQIGTPMPDHHRDTQSGSKFNLPHDFGPSISGIKSPMTAS